MSGLKFRAYCFLSSNFSSTSRSRPSPSWPKLFTQLKADKGRKKEKTYYKDIQFGAIIHNHISAAEMNALQLNKMIHKNFAFIFTFLTLATHYGLWAITGASHSTTVRS